MAVGEGEDGRMTGRIVLFGATGYTGELTARRLVADGAKPLLVGRREQAVKALAADLNLEHAVADAGHPDQVRALLDPGDVILSTVGPFLRHGLPAVQAAVDARAHYLDSTGEPPFIRRVFEEFGPKARAAGVGLLTAMGYDFVPGNLAGAIAAQRALDAGGTPTQLDVGYFLTGKVGAGAMSGGTRASVGGVMLAPSFAWRGGRLQVERGGAHVRSFRVGGRTRTGLTVGGSEHLALPVSYPTLQDVRVYLGWADKASRVVQVGGAVTGALGRLPVIRPVLERGVQRLAGTGSTGGPGPAERALTGSLAVAEAKDRDGRLLATAVLRGPNAYDLTAGLLSWGAIRALAGDLLDAGALGPVDGYGLAALTAAAAGLGLTADPA